jgi:hypothetical protein
MGYLCCVIAAVNMEKFQKLRYEVESISDFTDYKEDTVESVMELGG